MKSAKNRLSNATAGSSEVSDEIDAVKSSLKELRDDVVELFSHALGVGRGGAHSVRDSAVGAVDQVRDRLSDLKSMGSDRVSAFEHQLEERPFTTAMIAFGIGFLAATWLSRR